MLWRSCLRLRTGKCSRRSPRPCALSRRKRRLTKCRFLTLLERAASRQGLSTITSAASTTFFSGVTFPMTTVRCKCRAVTVLCGRAEIGFTTAFAAFTTTAACSEACSSSEHGKSVCARHTLNIVAAWHATLS